MSLEESLLLQRQSGRSDHLQRVNEPSSTEDSSEELDVCGRNGLQAFEPQSDAITYSGDSVFVTRVKSINHQS